MKKISLRDLSVSCYSEPIFLDENYILLTPATPVTIELKNRLLTWGYKYVFSNGSPTNKTDTLSLVKKEVNIAVLDINMKEKKKQDEAVKICRSVSEYLTRLFDIFLRKQILDIVEITSEVKILITAIKTHKNQMLNLSLIDFVENNKIVNQSLKTTIISLAIADFLKLPSHKQIDIGIVAMLHEIGMLRIPKELYEVGRVLSPEERKRLTTHTVLGFKILKTASFPMPLAIALLDHHERIDGQGYPRNLTGDKISLYGKIISVASSYVSAVSKRAYREGKDGHEGIMYILKDSKKKFDENIVRALVRILSIYPIGTHVLLSDNSKGVVINSNIEQPRFPFVYLITDAEGKPCGKHKTIQTSETGGVHIARTLTPEEISALDQR